MGSLVLGITLCLVVSAVRAEVITNANFRECSQFFYKAYQPQGFGTVPGLRRICQHYSNAYHYATLYSTEYRIPVYSAYTLPINTCPERQPKRRSTWFVEPQLSGLVNRSMDTQGRHGATIKRNQAINADFQNTDFDKGHLNPNSYQCYDGRTATFTLTNAVPQEPCFNQQMWKKVETQAKTIMETLCISPGAQRYFVTGAVPGDDDRRIPTTTDNDGDRTRELERVLIPTAMWTAACCFLPGSENGFSFAYYGENVPDSVVSTHSVADLEMKLAREFNGERISIFADRCNNNSDNSIRALKMLNKAVQGSVAEKITDLALSSESAVMPAKRRLISGATDVINGNTMLSKQNWVIDDADFGVVIDRSVINNIRNTLMMNTANSLTLLLSQTKAIPRGSQLFRTELRRKRSLANMKYHHLLQTLEQHQTTGGQQKQRRVKRDASVPAQDEYLVALSQGYTSNFTITGDRCRDGHYCDYHDGYSYKWCYTDWSDNWNRCCTGRCWFYVNKGDIPKCPVGQDWSDMRECSPRSSLVTVEGKRCRRDHECATHGESYFWCYIDDKNHYEKCCAPWSTCAYSSSEGSVGCYTSNTANEGFQSCNHDN